MMVLYGGLDSLSVGRLGSLDISYLSVCRRQLTVAGPHVSFFAIQIGPKVMDGLMKFSLVHVLGPKHVVEFAVLGREFQEFFQVIQFGLSHWGKSPQGLPQAG